MTYDITAPKTLDASIKLPASKSISNRALIIYALSGGEHVPTNLSDCDDTAVVINALKSCLSHPASVSSRVLNA